MSSLSQQLKKKKFYPSKKMGQNFLNDRNIIQKICDNMPDLSSYDCVIEIGPGLGAITNNLSLKAKHLICVELDKRLYAQLKPKFKSFKNVEIINDDFLEVDLERMCSKYKTIIVVANIPYSITTPIILKCLSFNKIKTLYIMVQKEVAEKWIYSKKSNRNASTNIINYYYEVNKIMNIKNTCFVPPPKVDSSMVILQRKNQEKYNPKLYSFIRPFFLAKRKKLLNNLAPQINKEKLIKFLKDLGYDSNVRSEELTYTDWKKIYLEFK